MNTITHAGNEYHIVNQFGGRVISTIAYRELEYDHIEIIDIDQFINCPELKDNVQTFQILPYRLKQILEHQEYLAEIQTQEGQEELNEEHERVLNK
jgi:hypothetical protein